MQLTSIITTPFRPLSGLFKKARPLMASDGVILPSGPVIQKKPSQLNSLSDDTDALIIPCPDPTAEDAERDYHHMRGQRLARQEQWDDISRALRLADRALSKTAGGMPVSELLGYGARADVVQACEHALIEGSPAEDASMIAGIEALEVVLSEHSDDYAIAVIVAHAHMDIGWAWRGTGWETEIGTRNRAAFDAHFARAADILAGFAQMEQKPASLCAAECALHTGQSFEDKNIADAYETLITLDPHNARAMRAMGNHLLPRWNGSYQSLELEARRTAARTQQIWGAGAYVWVQFDAIAFDEVACSRLDVGFFIDGLHDILERTQNQYIVNLLAAYCANTMGNARGGNDEADLVRTQIAQCAKWIIREHLCELHPMLWAHAARGFDNNLRVRCPDRFAASGQADALRIIGSMFRREIATGKRVVFTPEGAQCEPA